MISSWQPWYPGEEMIVFEPFYENYGPDAILSGAVPRFISLREPDWTFDSDELEALFNNKTRAIILNTPNNPTGKVFSRDELEFIARLCRNGYVSRSPMRFTNTLFTKEENISVSRLWMEWRIVLSRSMRHRKLSA